MCRNMHLSLAKNTRRENTSLSWLTWSKRMGGTTSGTQRARNRAQPSPVHPHLPHQWLVTHASACVSTDATHRNQCQHSSLIVAVTTFSTFSFKCRSISVHQCTFLVGILMNEMGNVLGIWRVCTILLWRFQFYSRQ